MKKYKKFITTSLILSLFLVFYGFHIAGAQVSGSVNLNNLNHNPESTSITVSGNATGGVSYDYACSGGEPYPDIETPTTLTGSYQIDGGANGTGALNLTETQYGQQQGCYGPELILYGYSYNQDINISGIPDGNHTMEVCVQDIWGTNCTPPQSFNKSSTPSFTTSCTPPTQTIATTASASYSISTTPSNGFNSAVNISSSISPSSGTIPTVSYINNGAVPGATTTAVVSTSSSTTPGTYTILFSASGGGVSNNCSRELIVSGPPPSFSFSITPNPTSVTKGAVATFTVTPVCLGGFNGTINALSASSTFTNVDYTFLPTTITCAQNTTLTVNNTGAVPTGELSPYGGSPIYKTITVTGQGN